MGKLLEYRIPEELKERIPDYFYIAMAGELASIFGRAILHPIDLEDDGDSLIYELNSGTAGWYAAFVMSCKKCDVDWLIDYRKTLPTWVEADIFDGEIETEIVKKIVSKEMTNAANSYYKYINERWVYNHDKEDENN